MGVKCARLRIKVLTTRELVGAEVISNVRFESETPPMKHHYIDR